MQFAFLSSVGITIDHFIILAYMVITLAIGLYVGRNVKSIRDYAVASKAYDTPILIITLIATIMGGTSTIGITENVYRDGVIMVLATTGFILAYLFISTFIAPKMEKFLGAISVGDLMYRFYGKPGQIITGLVGFLFCISIVAAQIKAIGFTFDSTFDTGADLGIMIGGGVLVTYSAFGGMRAVTITDVLQFAILIVMVPLIANIAVHHVGGVGHIFSNLPKEKFEVFKHEKFWDYLNTWFVWGLFPAFLVSPPIVQRMLMTRNKKQIASMFNVGAIFTVPFEIMVMLVGFVALIMYPSLSQPALALPNVINDLLPPIIKGLAISGILAVIMSTADSFLHSAGISLVHDFLEPIFGKRFKLNELFLTKSLTLMLGIGAILMATRFQRIMDLELYAVGLWGPLITIPLICGILGTRVPRSAFLYSVSAAFSVFVLWYLLDKSKMLAGMKNLPDLSAFLGIIASGLVFFISYLINAKNANYSLKRELFNYILKKCKDVADTLKHLIPTPQNIYRYSNNKFEKYGADYIMFGVFCCMNFIVPYFMWTYNEPKNYELMLGMRLTAGFLCVGLLLHSYWPKNLRSLFPVYWFFTAGYCLPFMTSVMILLTGAETEWLINMVLSIFLLALLVDALTFVILLTVFSGFGYLFYLLILDHPEIEFNNESIYLILYIIIFASLICLLFARKREIKQDEKLTNLRLIAGSIAHEVRTPIFASLMNAETLNNILSIAKITTHKDDISIRLPKADYQCVRDVICKNIIGSMRRGDKIIEMLLMSLKDSVVSDDIAKYRISEIIYEAINEYCLNQEEDKRLSINIKDDFIVHGSKLFLMHVLMNLLKNAYKYAGKTAKISIKTEGSKLFFKDTGVGMPEETLDKIFDRFYTSTGSGTGIGLAFCQMVMQSINGNISCRSIPGKETEFILEFVAE
jgi:Na+/proline symporter/signal transduction histidine kinase